MKQRSRLRVLAAGAAVVAALAVATPATVASAQPCSTDAGCSNGKPRTPAGERRTGWILYADADGRGSYWTWGVYVQDRQGHCFDLKGTGVGCPG